MIQTQNGQIHDKQNKLDFKEILKSIKKFSNTLKRQVNYQKCQKVPSQAVDRVIAI